MARSTHRETKLTRRAAKADSAPEPANNGSRTHPTLQRVADAAGVSRSTAARSLGNYGTVDPVLRERVLRVARELGYRRNALASSVSSE